MTTTLPQLQLVPLKGFGIDPGLGATNTSVPAASREDSRSEVILHDGGVSFDSITFKNIKTDTSLLE